MVKGQEFFIDSSKIDEIKRWEPVIRGVTTNQLIMQKDGIRDVDEHIRQILKLVPNGYPVSVELVDSTASKDDLVNEALRLKNLGENVVIKVPITRGIITEPLDPKATSTEMLEVIDRLINKNVSVNVTAMVTDMQMKLAVSILASRGDLKGFVSLFWGRSKDDHDNYRANTGFIDTHELEFGPSIKSRMGNESSVNQEPAAVVRSVNQFIGGRKQPRIIVGSIRTVAQAEEASAAGAHIVTVTPDILRAGLFSRKSIETIAEFDRAGAELKNRK